MSQFNLQKFKLKNGQKVIFRHCQPDDVHLFPEFQQKIAAESTNTMQVLNEIPPLDKVKENWAMCEDHPRFFTPWSFL